MLNRRQRALFVISATIPVLLVGFQNFSSSSATVKTYQTISSKIKKPLVQCTLTKASQMTKQVCAVPAANIVAINQNKLNDPRGPMACTPASFAMAFSTLDRSGYLANNKDAARQLPKLYEFHKLSPREKTLRLADEMGTDPKRGTSSDRAFSVASILSRIYGPFSLIYQGVQWRDGAATTFKPSYLRYRMARSELAVASISRFVLQKRTLISGQVSYGTSYQFVQEWGHAMYMKAFEVSTKSSHSDVNLVPDDSARYTFQDPAGNLDSAKILKLETIPKGVVVSLPGDLTPETTFILKERRLVGSDKIIDTERAGYYEGKPFFPVISMKYIQRSDVAIY